MKVLRCPKITEINELFSRFEQTAFSNMSRVGDLPSQVDIVLLLNVTYMKTGCINNVYSLCTFVVLNHVFAFV